MKSIELAKELRALADRVEAANLPAEQDCSIDLSFHGVNTREDLAKYAAFAGDPITVTTSENNSWLRRYTNACCRGNLFGICVFFEQGLIGGKVIEITKDTDAGLAELMKAPVVEEREPVAV